MDLVVEWEDGSFNKVCQQDLLPTTEKGSKALWIHNLSWECVIKNVEDDQNILVSWVADGKENLLSLADFCATRVENVRNFWRYDRKWKGTNRQKQNISSRGSDIGIRHEVRKKKVVNLVTQYDDSDGISSTSDSDSTVSACPSENDSSSDKNVPLASVASTPMSKNVRKDRILWNTQRILCHIQIF